MGDWKVYKHTTPDGKAYIGITSQTSLRVRFQNGYGYRFCPVFFEAIVKFGWDNITHEILEDNLTKEQALKREIYYIALFKTDKAIHGYNRTPGGYTVTKEMAKKISLAKKGKPNGKEGKIGADCAKSGILFQIDEITKKTVSVFHGYAEMNRETGYAQTPVKEAVAGKRARAYGYLWRYEKRGKKNVAI